VKLLKRLIDIFTDPGDVVIDPVAGSGSTLRAAAEMRRNAYGFEIDRNFYRRAKGEMLSGMAIDQMNILDFETSKNKQVTLWDA
jgi:site-specific DNA-methyltransferase (adenine-specific)